MIINELNKKIIAITIGDIDGIGINLLIKEYNRNKIKNFILITNIDVFNKKIKFPIRNINLIKLSQKFNYDDKKINIISFKTKNKYSNMLDSLKLAYKLTKKNLFKGILTLPINKSKINKYVNKNFIDQTSFFSKLDKSKYSNMFFVYKNKFFIPLTIHIEIKKVYNFFKNKDTVINKIMSINDTLKNDFKIPKPKLIMAGINPHAGENGIISKDDNKLIQPIIKYLKKKNINITGPISGDGMITKYNLSSYDAFIFTFHDQALIPFKIISKYGGVNFTSKLNIIRTSPSHGTGEDIIGTKYASSSGILNSFKLINKIYKNRNKKW